VRHALRAVEGDSALRVAARWRRALSRDPTDRRAVLGLATVARLTYAYAEADSQYRALLAPEPPALGDGARDGAATYAALGVAWALDVRGSSADADTAFARARAMAQARGDRAAEAEALIGVSVHRASQHGISAGLALLDTAARLAPVDARDEQAGIAVRRALFAAVLRRRSAAAGAAAALRLAEQAGEPRLQALALQARALGLELAARADSAASVLAAVERIERAVRDRAMLGETLLRHGDIARARGDIGAARQYDLAARAEALASSDRSVLAASDLGLGSVALLLDDQVTAADYLRQAAALYDRVRNAAGSALVASAQAELAAAQGNWSVARDLESRVRDFDRSVGDPAEFDRWRDLITIDIHLDDLAGAERALAGAEALARAAHRGPWDRDLDLDRGRLALAEGRPAAAVAALTRHLQGLDSTEHTIRYTSRTQLAEAEARQGQLARAELELTAAADELDAWRSTITDHALRPSIFRESASDKRDRDAGVATVLAAMAAAGRQASAFALAERWRARELADRLVRLGALEAPVAASSSTEMPGPRDPPDRDRPPGSLTSEGDVALRAATERGVADSVAAALPDSRTAFLEFVTGAGGAPTTLFVIGRPLAAPGRAVPPAALRTYRLASADSLAAPAARMLALLESGRDASEPARALGAAVLDSALRGLGPEVDHLIIAPDGPLRGLPFDALRLADGAPVVARYTVSTAPSGAVIRALWRRPRPAAGDHRPARLLALAAPDSGPETAPPAVAASAPSAPSVPLPPGSGPSGDGVGMPPAGEAEVYRNAFDATGGLPPLPGSAREVRLVARYAQASVVRLGADASAAFLLHAPLDGFRVIHLATHALADARTVARTALALSPGGGESGFVTPAQLAGLRLRADLIVLSAARTVGAAAIDGEGAQALTGSLLAAGARSVVATRWRIGDRAAVPLIDAFYAALARGLGVGDALRAAKRDAIARGEPASSWASFTAVGDPLVRVPLRSPRVGTTAVLAALVALTVLVTAIVLGPRLLARRASA